MNFDKIIQLKQTLKGLKKRVILYVIIILQIKYYRGQ